MRQNHIFTQYWTCIKLLPGFKATCELGDNRRFYVSGQDWHIYGFGGLSTWSNLLMYQLSVSVKLSLYPFVVIIASILEFLAPFFPKIRHLALPTTECKLRKYLAHYAFPKGSVYESASNLNIMQTVIKANQLGISFWLIIL